MKKISALFGVFLCAILLVISFCGCRGSDSSRVGLADYAGQDEADMIQRNIAEALDNSSDGDIDHVAYSLLNATEVQTPVAVLVRTRDGYHDAGSFAFLQSEKLQTAEHLSDAKSYLYVECLLDSNGNTDREYYVQYDVYAASADYSGIAKLDTNNGEGARQEYSSKRVKNKDRLTDWEKNDAAFIDAVLKLLTFSPSAPDDAAVVMEYFTGYVGIDYGKVYAALEQGDYAQDQRLSGNPSLLPCRYGYLGLACGCDPENVDKAQFRRAGVDDWTAALQGSRPKEANHIDTPVLAEAIRGGLPHIVGVSERVGLDYFAHYYGMGDVYTYAMRFSFVNLDSGELIAWEDVSSSAQAPSSISSQFLHEDDYGNTIAGGQYGVSWNDLFE